MKFSEILVSKTVERLLNGEDYRSEVINAINLEFLEWSLEFFKQIVEAKFNNTALNFEWYKSRFINENLESGDVAIFAGINKKSITNIYGHATKSVVLDVANQNLEYLSGILNELENDNLAVSIEISYNQICVRLNLSESLLVINALATKKIALRGGAWSSVGKRVEKPLMLELCRRCGVAKSAINAEIFKKNSELDFDREVDFWLINKFGKKFRVEVKLMGKGNPESADAVIARDSNIFVADTLSLQNKNQLKVRGVEFLELKNNGFILEDFRAILKRLDVEFGF